MVRRDHVNTYTVQATFHMHRDTLPLPSAGGPRLVCNKAVWQPRQRPSLPVAASHMPRAGAYGI